MENVLVVSNFLYDRLAFVGADKGLLGDIKHLRFRAMVL